MNAIEVYKKLPKKNCGECGQKSCLPFALSLVRAEAEPGECPHLTPDEIDELKSTVVHSDWREELIQRLMGEIREKDFREVASHIGAELRNEGMMLRCMEREFMVDADGGITAKGHITPWMKILLLHYIKTGGSVEMSGKWVSFSQLKSGMVKASSFGRECEEPLRELFDRHKDDFVSALERFGATVRDDFPTKDAWHVLLLPRIPVVILYWPEDNEFPSKLKILFDSTADRFLDVETIIFLVEGLVHNLETAVTSKDH